MNFAGIDYSMSSPALCIYTGNVNDLRFSKCNFFVYSDTKKIPILENVKIDKQITYTCQEERFDNISNWAIKLIKEYKIDKIALEGYSYASKSSRIFDIGENGGVLKNKIWKENIPFVLYAPGEVKRHFTGKGNANKELMYENLKLKESIDMGKDFGSPVSDIVDSYAILSLLVERTNTIDT